MNYERLDVKLIGGSQSMKDCKNQTPDFKDANNKKGTPQIGFKSKDEVNIEGTLSLLNKVELKGLHIFDSYDKYDNTCYVTKPKGSITYSVELTKIKLV